MSFMLVADAFGAHLPGVTLQRARSAAEAIALARCHRPDLILLDLRLPDLPGLEVVRALSGEISTGAIDVIIVTADKLTADLVEARALGVGHILFKPIDIWSSLALVERVLGRRGQHARNSDHAEHE